MSSRSHARRFARRRGLTHGDACAADAYRRFGPGRSAWRQRGLGRPGHDRGSPRAAAGRDAQQAARLHRSTASLRRSMTSQAVTARTAADVSALYARLWNTGPPQATAAQRAAAERVRTHATAQGWRPPLAWDDMDTDPDEDVDHIAVERAIAGYGLRLATLTLVKQQAVIGHPTQRGRSIHDIAGRTPTWHPLHHHEPRHGHPPRAQESDQPRP
jgi:hypothetical protein